jgi:thiol-disulfide isomerase/thioredoxin
MKRLGCLIVASIIAYGLVPTRSQAKELPRYSFAVGRQLSYVEKEEFKNGDSTLLDQVSTRLTVVGKNGNGSFRIVIRSASRDVYNTPSEKKSLEAEPEQVTFSQIVVRPDGRMISSIGRQLESDLTCLPPLPVSEAEQKSGWSVEPEIPGMTWLYQYAGQGKDGTVRFRLTNGGLFKDILATHVEGEVVFDPAKGLVTSVSSTTRQDYGFVSTGTTRCTLERDETLPAEVIAPFARDVEIILAAKRDMDDKRDAIREGRADVKATVDAIRKSLDDAIASLKTDEMKSQLKRLRSKLDDRAKDWADDAARVGKLLGRPLPDYSGNDLDGKPHKLSDYRGKVLVLDFWYRSCGWCIRAMPQIKQSAKDFAGKPVVFLGMNTDRKADDALFVVKALGLPYAQIQMPMKESDLFGVEAFPTMIIVDQKGIVRDFHAGYRSNLRVELDWKIQALLDAR